MDGSIHILIFVNLSAHTIELLYCIPTHTRVESGWFSPYPDLGPFVLALYCRAALYSYLLDPQAPTGSEQMFLSTPELGLFFCSH